MAVLTRTPSCGALTRRWLTRRDGMIFAEVPPLDEHYFGVGPGLAYAAPSRISPSEEMRWSRTPACRSS
jgi:hypothetical protein